MRELPTLFRTPPSTDMAGNLSVWCHPLTIGGAATGVALVFSGECPVRELLVGSEQQRQHCKLEAAFPMTLSAAQARLAAQWLVGSLDLTQAGNSGEPLHPSFSVPQQLLKWDHLTGTFSPNPIAEVPAMREVAGLDSFPLTREWREHRKRFPHEPHTAAVHKLTCIIASLVQRLNAALADASSHPAVIVTVDLDRTLWKGECLEWPVGSFRRHSETALSDEEGNRLLELHAEVPLVFAALKQATVQIAVASASIAADSASALLSCFGLHPDAIEMGDDEEKRGGRKVAHLQSLSERLGVPIDRFVLFDDSEANVHRVRELLGPADAEAGCSATCVDPATGLTAEALLLGLEHRLAELKLRRRFAEERRRDEGRGSAYKEKLRKMKQSHAETLAQGQAHLDDQYRIASKLEQLPVEPGWWLAVPLAPDGGASHAGTLDWHLMEHAASLFSTCKWPSLADAEHSPLVQANARVDDDDRLAAGPVDLCALATYATERHLHYNLLLHVSAEGDGDNMAISGDVRSRQAHVGATAAKRIVQADGWFRTQETERAVGYRLHNVRLLPMRSSHHDALRVLRRLLWRLEHRVRLTEPDVGALFGAEAGAVPLDRLSAALTHRGASAEAVRVSGPSLPRAPSDRSLHDERGCCQWEELEWLGDGILRFYAVVWVLVNHRGTSFRGLSHAKQTIENNLALHRQAKQLGLPTLSLCTPFVTSATLPHLRKQACSIKDQADPMEALLGAVALAGIDAAPTEPALPMAIHAAFGFFRSAVLPPQQDASAQPAQPFDTAKSLLDEFVTQFRHCHKDVENDELARDLRAALVVPMGPIPFEVVGNMLHACSLCRSGIAFERAEFFGDAFLQIAVSLELARRFPERQNGDLSGMRSALVNNLHLGRLLIRRFGAELTERFVATSGSGVAHKRSQLRAIRTFIGETQAHHDAHASEPLDVVAALRGASTEEEEGDKARVRAQVLAADGLVEEDESLDGEGDSPYYSKRGDDFRKPLGDQYEAIVGLVFCAYSGDCEATWRYFVGDFFPEAVDENRRAQASAELHALRQKRAKLELQRQWTTPSMAAAAATPLGASVGNNDLVETHDLVGAHDVVMDVDHDTETAQGQIAPLIVAARCATSATDEAAHTAAPFASAVAVAAAAPSPSTEAAPQYGNPIGAVHERLQQSRVSISDFLRQEPSPSSVPPFCYQLSHVGSGQLLGCAAGYTKKQEAKRAAYSDMLHNWDKRGIPQLIEEFCKVAMPLSEGAPPHTAPSLAQQQQLEGGKRALAADVRGLRSFARGLKRTLSAAAEANEASREAALDEIVGSLEEENVDYVHKIRSLAWKAMLPSSALQAIAHKAVELSRRVRPRPPEAQRSAGRLFHDALDVLREEANVPTAEHEPERVPRLGDMVCIVGYQNAPQHNGKTGKVVAAPDEQRSHGRLAVATEDVPAGLPIREAQLQLRRLGEASLGRLSPRARQLTHYLQTAEDDPFDGAMLRAHGLELPLFFFHTYPKLRGMLDDERVPPSPHARLAALQAAVREAPTLSLCGAYDDRVRRRCDLEDANQDEASVFDPMEVERPHPDGGATFDAMVLPADAHDGEPRVVHVPLRADYLHAIIESLVSRNGGIGAPLGMHARYAGQKTEQPVLYFLIVPAAAEGSASAVASPRRNERASRLAGYDIFGDAILADVELEPPSRSHPTSRGVPVCERFLAMELADPLAFTLASASMPLLGCWALPRLAAWPATRRPKAVMEEFMRRHCAHTGCFMTPSSWPVHTQADGVTPQAHTPFVGTVQTDMWLRDGRRPPSNQVWYNEELQCHELRSLPLPPPRRDAENAAVLLMMHMLSDTTPSPPWVPTREPRRVDEAIPEAVPEAAAAAGSTVVCSYTLFLENQEGGEACDGVDSAGAAGATAAAGGTRLEEQSEMAVVLGAGVLHPTIEMALAELAGEWQARDASAAGAAASDGSTHAVLPATCDLRIGARYHGVDVSCLLTLTVHSVVRGEEDSEYELAGGPEGLGALRMQKLHELLHELRPTCLVDVGCGEGSLLLRMLDGNAPSSLARLVGVDVELRALKRGARKLRTARANLMSSGTVGVEVPSVQMLRTSLADVDAARLTSGHAPDAAARMPPDVLTLVEVVEHLDAPELDALGPALLGRCAPRALIVTTPNKEYNLNRMVCCQNRTECEARHEVGLGEEARRRMIARGELCKGCALFCSGQPPPLESYPLRNKDHRFEFTRRGFREWAEDLGSKHGYTVRYDGVGGGPLDEPYLPTNCFHGPGPSALVCIFERRTGSTPVPSQVSTGGVGASSSAPLCVWDSEACPHAQTQ